MGFIDQLKAVWPLVMQAPWGFATLAAALLVAGWFAARIVFTERIETLKERIEAYKEKLGGASPDEAAQKIAALENRLDSLTPVPIEELEQNLKHAEALARQKQIQKLVDRYSETHTGHPPDEWINGQLKTLGLPWRATHKGTHYETYEPARWG
jgi:hypothetical protein